MRLAKTNIIITEIINKHSVEYHQQIVQNIKPVFKTQNVYIILRLYSLFFSLVNKTKQNKTRAKYCEYKEGRKKKKKRKTEKKN